jgi:hypothetical protein
MHHALLSLFAIVAHLHVVSSVSSSVEGGSHKPHKLLRAEEEDPAGSHGVDEKKIERQAAWAERLERRQLLTPRQKHQGGVHLSEAEHSKRMQQALADLTDDIKKAADAQNEYLTKKSNWDTATKKTKCVRNTFIMDWGSTGARVFLAHHADNKNEALLHDLSKEPSDAEKKAKPLLDGYGAPWGHKISIKSYLDQVGTTAETIGTMLDHFMNTTGGSTAMAAAATAGNRLMRAESNQAWELLQKGNEKVHVLQNCKTSTKTGCQTIPGSQEAEYEFKSAYSGGTPANRGMISAGGASLQFAFTVTDANHASAEPCAAAIRAVTGSAQGTPQIEKAANYVSGEKLLTFSWLADRKHKNTVAPTNQLLVGGVNEMRAAFDRFYVNKSGTTSPWLTALGGTLPKHPCLKGAWPQGRIKTDGSAADTATETHVASTQYLSDKYNSFYTLLPGSADADAKIGTCVTALREFVQSDFMMKAFKSGGCASLVPSGASAKWTLISSFKRDLKSSFADRAALHAAITARTATSTDPIPTTEDTYTDFFHQTLLLVIMDELGMFKATGTDSIQFKGAEWLDEFAKALAKPLRPGWLPDADCPALT